MVLLALTELVAELAFWTARKTLSYSWRGMWWGVQQIRGNAPDTTRSQVTKPKSEDLQVLVETITELREQVKAQERDIAELQRIV